MVRDPGMEQAMREDLGQLPGLAEKPMFGGLCFLSDGHMICAARHGRAMYRVGKTREPDALALPGTARMVHNGRAYAGWVYLDEHQLSDDATRARLTGWAKDCVRALPPKE